MNTQPTNLIEYAVWMFRTSINRDQFVARHEALGIANSGPLFDLLASLEDQS
jgi:hypothetical protein